MPGWRDVPVVDALSAATGLPAMLDKDTNAALTGEIWSRHLDASQTVLYLYVGHGVGSAISANGRVHRAGAPRPGRSGTCRSGGRGRSAPAAAPAASASIPTPMSWWVARAPSVSLCLPATT